MKILKYIVISRFYVDEIRVRMALDTSLHCIKGELLKKVSKIIKKSKTEEELNNAYDYLEWIKNLEIKTPDFLKTCWWWDYDYSKVSTKQVEDHIKYLLKDCPFDIETS